MNEQSLLWTDLPNDDYEQILGYQSNQTIQLNKLSKSYHDLEKDDANNLQLRIDRLEDIVEFLDCWLKKHLSAKDKPKHLRTLKEIADKKVNYLLALTSLSQKSTNLNNYMQDYLHDVSKLKDNNKHVLYLNKLRMYSIQKGEYWGDFACVVLDHCNRQLTNYLQIWEQTKNANGLSIEFYLWLEKQYVPKHQPIEKFLTQDELSDLVLTVKDGKLIQSNGELANFSSKVDKYLFIIDLDEKFYVTKETTSMYHSCFTRAKPVLVAGKILIEQGIIKMVSFESGHYIPSIKHAFQLFMVLSDKGYIVHDSIHITYFYDRNKYSLDIKQQDLNTLDRFEFILEQNKIICSKAIKEKVEDVQPV